jgi:hypothetical protein
MVSSEELCSNCPELIHEVINSLSALQTTSYSLHGTPQDAAASVQMLLRPSRIPVIGDDQVLATLEQDGIGWDGGRPTGLRSQASGNGRVEDSAAHEWLVNRSSEAGVSHAVGSNASQPGRLVRTDGHRRVMLCHDGIDRGTPLPVVVPIERQRGRLFDHRLRSARAAGIGSRRLHGSGTSGESGAVRVQRLVKRRRRVVRNADGPTAIHWLPVQVIWTSRFGRLDRQPNRFPMFPRISTTCAFTCGDNRPRRVRHCNDSRGTDTRTNNAPLSPSQVSSTSYSFNQTDTLLPQTGTTLLWSVMPAKYNLCGEQSVRFPQHHSPQMVDEPKNTRSIRGSPRATDCLPSGLDYPSNGLLPS